MKPTTCKSAPLFLGFAVAGAALILISSGFKQTPPDVKQRLVTSDTIPQKDKNRDRKVRDLDEAIDNLDNFNMNVEMDKAMEEVNKAMKEINFDKLKIDIDLAMKNVDMDKIKLDIDAAMKDIDMKDIQAETDKAMKSIDWSKIKTDINESLAKIDWNKMKVDIDNSINLEKMNLDLEKMKVDLSKMGPEIQKALEGAKVEIQKAKAELKEYKIFVDDLDQEGLINKKEPYTLEHKDGKLLINGKEAPAKVYEKHKNFLKKHETFNINKDDDDFNIDLD